VMWIEVDDFDTQIQNVGPEGDRVIMDAVGEILIAMLREMDLATETRNGQMSVMLPGSEIGDAAGVSERIRQTIADRPLGDDSAAQITVSLGLSQVIPCDDVAALLARADEALSASLKARGNCGHQHDGKQLRAITGNVASD
jgi:diguanylate cyclase (GGDEF)-like protein